MAMREHDAATDEVETLIIGAGQTGLAAGYHLARRGLPFLIVDANERVGDQWRRRYASLRLFSPARWDGLPGHPFPAPGWSSPTGRQMADHLESYAASFDLPVRTGVRVERLSAAGDGSGGFIAMSGRSRIRAQRVIVATGAYTVPWIPDLAARLDPAIRQLHSTTYHDPSDLADGPVLVVGLGHSGADIALEVARTHRTIVSGRPHGELPIRVLDTWRARVFLPILGFMETHVLTIRTPIGRRAAARSRILPAPLLRVRRVDLRRAGAELHESRVASVQHGWPVLEDGTVVDALTVIWCTGARPDYDWIDLRVTGADGWPVGDRGVSPIAGVYFLGVPFQYGLTSTLIDGADRDATYIVDRIASEVAATSSSRTAPQATATA
jgi:putative flavoprotein involved in K+ transport